MRSLLVLGARAVLTCKNRSVPSAGGLLPSLERRGYWRAIVAIAANARMAWASLTLARGALPCLPEAMQRCAKR